MTYASLSPLLRLVAFCVSLRTFGEEGPGVGHRARVVQRLGARPKSDRYKRSGRRRWPTRTTLWPVRPNRRPGSPAGRSATRFTARARHVARRAGSRPGKRPEPARPFSRARAGAVCRTCRQGGAGRWTSLPLGGSGLGAHAALRTAAVLLAALVRVLVQVIAVMVPFAAAATLLMMVFLRVRRCRSAGGRARAGRRRRRGRCAGSARSAGHHRRDRRSRWARRARRWRRCSR
jgi:hypothetical protein